MLYNAAASALTAAAAGTVRGLPCSCENALPLPGANPTLHSYPFSALHPVKYM